MGERLPGFGATTGAAAVERPVGRVVRVQPDITSVDRTFDYLVPEAWEADGRADKVAIGSLVRIDFGGRRTAGWITEVDVEPNPDVDILPLAKWSSVGPPGELVDLAQWAAWRWAGRVPHFLRAASPPRMVPAVRQRTGRPSATDVADERGVFERGDVTLVVTPPPDRGVELARLAASRGRALILTPTVDDRRHIVRALRDDGFDVAEYPEQWERSAGGSVTVGTRLAAWAPLTDLDAVLVLDEHDSAYKEERTPSWNARDVALERARRAEAPCVLASPAPSLEASELADRRLVADRSTERESWPIVEVVDLRKTERPGLLTDAIVDAVRAPAPVACILNRKGRAQMLACATCDSLAACDACGAAVSQPEQELVCRSCGTVRPVVCAECGATKLKLIRPGISRVAEELRALSKRDVVEVTADTPQQDLGGDRLVIGTEAVLHRISYARSVIFLDFDQELAMPRARASEDAFALLALAARRLGPRSDGGRLFVQTRRPDHVVVQAALHGNGGSVARAQRDIRRVFAQPPYGAWALISGAGAQQFVDALEPRDGLVLRRIDDRWRAEAPDHDLLLTALNGTPRPADRVRVEVDPLRV